MNDLLSPMDLIRNVSAWMRQMQDNMKSKQDISVFDIYVALESARLELDKYILIQAEMMAKAESDGTAQTVIEDFTEPETPEE